MNDILNRENYLADSIKELEKVNKQIAKLTVRKEELVNMIIGALGHEHEGQKSYEYGVWKIEVKTPFVYSLNKKRYESGEIKLPDNFNPIKQSVAYSIDKRLCDQFMQEAPKKVRDALAELIDKKPGKAGITLKERV
jgi:exonuclease VII small subunit